MTDKKILGASKNNILFQKDDKDSNILFLAFTLVILVARKFYKLRFEYKNSIKIILERRKGNINNKEVNKAL